MDIIITMAGLGSRFKNAGYTVPKYRIEAKGKSLFAWSMLSLRAMWKESRFFFIARREDEAWEFLREECREMGIGEWRLIELERPTGGQAETALYALPYWESGQPLLIYNIDTYVEPGLLSPAGFHGDGFLPCFRGEGDHWSFVRLDETGQAAEVREKRRISPLCTVGAYYFRSCGLFRTLYETDYGSGLRPESGERYVAPLYNRLIAEGGKVFVSDIPREKVHVLGTPEELQAFLEGALHA